MTSTVKLTETIIVRKTDAKYVKNLIKFWTDGGMSNLSISLNCPVSKMRLKMPCRGMDCTHLQCFDGATFLKMNERQFGKWLCNICEKPSPLNKLFVDGLLLDILNTVSEDIDVIYFDDKGNWLDHDPSKDSKLGMYNNNIGKMIQEIIVEEEEIAQYYSVIDLCETLDNSLLCETLDNSLTVKEVIDLTGSDDDSPKKSKESTKTNNGKGSANKPSKSTETDANKENVNPDPKAQSVNPDPKAHSYSLRSSVMKDQSRKPWMPTGPYIRPDNSKGLNGQSVRNVNYIYRRQREIALQNWCRRPLHQPCHVNQNLDIVNQNLSERFQGQLTGLALPLSGNFNGLDFQLNDSFPNFQFKAFVVGPRS